MRQQLRRYLHLLAVVLTLVTGSYWLSTPFRTSTTPTPRTTAILTTDTREPHVGLDPDVPLSSWTVTTLSNHLYARSIGAKYVYYKIEAPTTEDELPPVNYKPHLGGYCEHRIYGWRTSHFCKMPFMWWFIRTNRDVENFVYIDSDAMFRDPNLHVDRHTNSLSLDRPFGILTNRPWDDGQCSGYWFMYRPKGEYKAAYDVLDFVLEWWNEDWADTRMELYDQSTIRRMIGGDTNGGRVGPPRDKTYLNQVVVLDEWAFELKSTEQMILHIGHMSHNRDQQLADAWPWEDDYPLCDRERLAALLEEVDIRMSSAQAITSKMPLPKRASSSASVPHA